MTKLVLASSSRYRKMLLDKLHLPYRCVSPDIDETALANETPEELVTRLALGKARAAAKQQADSLIIGSDQIACVDQRILTKPGNFAIAQQQLQQCNGKTVAYLTGLCLFNSNTGKYQLHVERYHLKFRDLSPEEIDNYLKLEQPYDCAGAIKSEGLAVTLLAEYQGRDPNALIGLPLIKLLAMLRHEGVNPLTSLADS